MTSRFITLLLCAGAIAAACGPRARSTDTTSTVNRAQQGKPLATSLNVRVNDGVSVALHVTNTGESRLELRFASGQTHDFAVLDSTGRELWRWSGDRMFTQALQNKLLDVGETIRFEERWDPRGLTGRFTAVGYLTSSNYPVEERVEFTLP